MIPAVASKCNSRDSPVLNIKAFDSPENLKLQKFHNEQPLRETIEADKFLKVEDQDESAIQSCIKDTLTIPYSKKSKSRVHKRINSDGERSPSEYN